MLKFIGIGMMIAGIALFIFTMLRGRQKGITSDMKELSMIISSGYVSERAPDEKKASPFEGKVPIKPAPKKKRVLSEEARGILEMVERDRENEALASAQAKKEESAQVASPSPEAKKGTAVLPEDEKKGTAVLPEVEKKGTAVLPDEKKSPHEKKGTAVLSDVHANKRGTAVLVDPSPKKGTAVLKESSSPTPKKGTAVLREQEEPKTEKQKKGAAVLQNNAASIRWQDPAPEKDRKGTAVLEQDKEVPKKKGTAVLGDPAPDEEAASNTKKGTAVLSEKGGKIDG